MSDYTEKKSGQLTVITSSKNTGQLDEKGSTKVQGRQKGLSAK